jgi:nitroimidazol reductase NimA-like FMN-containing flavoprotein (pyridoxamine 5'-phosphate oxidase superfamily)
MAAGSMTRTERETFLADLHVGVLGVEDPGRGPFCVPIWYLVDDDGTVVIHMDGTSKKARLLRSAGRASLVAQDEAPPYKYVSVEGSVTIGPADDRLLEMATRYLGEEFGALYVEANPPTADSVVVRLVDEHWNTMDFAKLLG